MDFRRLVSVFGLLCACDSLDSPSDASMQMGGRPEPEPLPADLVAACPETAGFDRTSKNECTAIGCSSGFSLDVSPSGAWAPGAYRFELAIDGREVVCEGALPLKPCAERSFSCDADGVRLGESGCALEPAAQGIASIALDGFPLALAIRVLKDGEELTSTELTPTYKAGQPNGPGCDPVCCSASGTLTVP